MIGDGLWYCNESFSLENCYFTVLWRDFSGGTGYLGRMMGTVQSTARVVREAEEHGGMAQIGPCVTSGDVA